MHAQARILYLTKQSFLPYNRQTQAGASDSSIHTSCGGHLWLQQRLGGGCSSSSASCSRCDTHHTHTRPIDAAFPSHLRSAHAHLHHTGREADRCLPGASAGRGQPHHQRWRRRRSRARLSAAGWERRQTKAAAGADATAAAKRRCGSSLGACGAISNGAGAADAEGVHAVRALLLLWDVCCGMIDNPRSSIDQSTAPPGSTHSHAHFIPSLSLLYRRRPQCVGKGQQQQEHAHATVAGAAAGSGTALRALLAPEYDIIHVAGDVVAGFVGGCVPACVHASCVCACMQQKCNAMQCSAAAQLSSARASSSILTTDQAGPWAWWARWWHWR